MMQPPLYSSTQIVTALADHIQKRGLRLDKLDEPVSARYTEQWVVRDSENWNYAGFSIVGQGYEYSLVSSDTLPFEAQETIDWIEQGILEIVSTWVSPTQEAGRHQP